MDPPVPLLWACAAIFMAIAARQKGRSGTAWFFLGLVLGPLAFVALLTLPTLDPPVPWSTRHTFALTSQQKWWLSLVALAGIYLVFLFGIWRSQFLDRSGELAHPFSSQTQARTTQLRPPNS